MGSASLIASAIALILLIITAYVLVGWTLATAEIVGFAQKEQTQLQETRLRTSIEIQGTSLAGNASPLYVQLKNTGTEMVSGFDDMDVYLVFGSEPVYYSYSPDDMNIGTWYRQSIAPDDVHPHALDPDEVMTMAVYYSGAINPVWVQVTTRNGVSDSAYI
jgi:flagellar protein FlaF